MESLQNHLLIAMPMLHDSFFERSVIYLWQHDEQGAMGLMINRPIGIDINKLLERMQLDDGNRNIELNDRVLLGGPVNPKKGFVLHSTQKTRWSSSQQLNDELVLTTSKDVLSSLGTKAAPNHAIIALGYASWEPDQLEQELSENSWLSIPVTTELLFNTDPDERWLRSTQTLGFDIWQLSSQAGHA